MASHVRVKKISHKYAIIFFYHRALEFLTKKTVASNFDRNRIDIAILFIHHVDERCVSKSTRDSDARDVNSESISAGACVQTPSPS